MYIKRIFWPSLFFAFATYADSLPFPDSVMPPATPEKLNGVVGQYVSGNLGLAYAQETNNNGFKHTHVFGIGANVFLGDQLTPYFAPEIGFSYNQLGENDHFTLLTLNFRLNKPIGRRENLFVKLGLGHAELKVCNWNCVSAASDNSLAWSFGGGMGINLTRLWMATAEFNGTYLPDSLGNGKGWAGTFTLGLTRYFSDL